jgi:zinc transporter 2
MFFVLHANVCGTNIPHHGHSHGGGGYERLEDTNHGHAQEASHGHSHEGSNHGHSHEGDNHGHSHEGDNHGHSHNDKDATRKDIPLTSQAASEKKLEKISSKHELSDNINVRAAIVHVIGDFVQSIGVLVAAILIKINVCSKK